MFLGVWSSQQAPGDRLLINDGSGVFSNEPNRLPYPMVAWEAARASKAADFDGDGRVDLAVQRSIGGLLVLRGTAAGSFVDVSQQWNPFGLSCPAIHLADFDGDGRVDVLRLGYDSMLLRNTGSSLQLISGHTTTPFVIQSLPQFPAVGDFDSDGDTDIVFGSAGFGHAQWNLRRQLSMPMLAMPGQPLPIRVHARTGSSPPSFAAVVAIATARERSQTPFGTCWFDPGSLLSLHAVLAPAGAGMAEFVVDIPPWNFLQGTELTVQALMFGAGSPSPALTNAITTGIR